MRWEASLEGHILGGVELVAFGVQQSEPCSAEETGQLSAAMGGRVVQAKEWKRDFRRREL